MTQPGRAQEAAVRRDAMVLAAAVSIVAVTFGVLASSAGLSLAKASVMSLLVFTGASQFAAVGVIASGGSVVSAVSGALLLAARNGLYGMRLSELIRADLGRTVVRSQLVIDESTGMALTQSDPADQRTAFYWTGLGIFIFWNLGTVAGVLLGDVVGDPERFGLDAAFPASFLALILPHVESVAGRLAAGGGVLISLALVPVLPAGVPILFGALAVLPAQKLSRRWTASARANGDGQ